MLRGKGEQCEGEREEVGLEGVMLQQGARGTVRLGKEVCVHIPGFPTAAGEEGGVGQQEKRGEMNGKTASEEAAETCIRDIFPIYHSSSLQKENAALQVKLVRRITLMRLAFQTLPVRALCSQHCDWMRICLPLMISKK